LGHGFQAVDDCPSEPHDEPVDACVTEDGLHETGARPLALALGRGGAR
jgi:5-formyltetrahydrofolate cyclo-ligase